MSASTATSASIAAASAGPAEGCRFPVRREKPGIFSVRPRPRRPKHSKNNWLLENSRGGKREFSRLEPGMDRRNREFTGNYREAGSVPPLPRLNRNGMRQLCGRIADVARRFRRRAKQLVFFIARLPIAA